MLYLMYRARLTHSQEQSWEERLCFRIFWQGRRFDWIRWDWVGWDRIGWWNLMEFDRIWWNLNYFINLINLIGMKLGWNCDEIGMELEWNWDEIGMGFRWNWDWIAIMFVGLGTVTWRPMAVWAFHIGEISR